MGGPGPAPSRGFAHLDFVEVFAGIHRQHIVGGDACDGRVGWVLRGVESERGFAGIELGEGREAAFGD